jgi:putative photosynthetic complex assembly protein 2
VVTALPWELLAVEFALPVLFALFVWWFGTGVVMLLDNLPQRSHRLSLSAGAVLALGALVCITRTAGHNTVGGAYAAFTCAVIVWGWFELAFLTGWLTGPRKTACSAPAHGPTRFHEAVQVILWHELAILAAGLLITAIVWDAPNHVAAWTFGLLWAMRLSAKLNLFLGVRNRGLEFLPTHLLYLGSYFRPRRANALLPLSLLAGGAVAVRLVDQALDAGGAQRVSLMLVAAMLSLAVLEHLLMVVPLQSSALWRWAMRQTGSGERAAAGGH